MLRQSLRTNLRNCQNQLPTQPPLLKQYRLLHQRPHPNHLLHQHVSLHHPPRQPHLPRGNPLRHPNSDTLTSSTTLLLHPLVPQSRLARARAVRILLMSGPNTHAPEKSLRLLKVKVHPYRNAQYPRSSPWGPFAGLGHLRHMVHPSHRPYCRVGKRAAVRSSRASRNSSGVRIPGAIRAILGCIRGRLLGRFPALLFAIGV